MHCGFCILRHFVIYLSFSPIFLFESLRFQFLSIPLLNTFNSTSFESKSLLKEAIDFALLIIGF